MDMDMDTFFSEPNIASLRHLALPGTTATDRAALLRVLDERFINAQHRVNIGSSHSRDGSRRAINAGSALGQGRREAPNGKPGSIAC